MGKITLNGNTLTRQEVIDVACNHARVEIDTSNLKKSLDYINAVIGKKIVYSITTGFGSNADKPIPLNKALELQVNLLRSHACGTGNPFPKEIVRAIMVIRLNTLLKGHSGVRVETVRKLAFLLNKDIHPVIPEQGSVGASGDLCPLSHMALPLIGEGEIEYKDKTYTTSVFVRSRAARKLGFKKTTLSYKEGLALNNGTTVMTAVGVIALHKAERLLKINTLSSALIFESLCARKNSFGFDEIHKTRGQKGQTEIAKWLKKILRRSRLIDMSQNKILAHLLKKELIPQEFVPVVKKINSVTEMDEQVQLPEFVIDKIKHEGGKAISASEEIKSQNNGKETPASKLLSKEGKKLLDTAAILKFAKKKWKPQDSYSIRCIPQVFGASKAAIDHAIAVIDTELNAAVDNPLIFSNDGVTGNVISGGNFHGQPIALVMDYLKLALAEMGNITERQINKMVDAATNDGLESFLVYGNGVISGLMIPQYVAASIVSENKVLVHPASADSIPTCENTEDHVSMGTIAARQALQIADNVEKIAAIAIMTGFYAVNMRLQQFKYVEMESAPEKNLAPATLAFYKAIKIANREFQKEAVTNDNTGFLQTDRFLQPEINAIRNKLGEFAAIAQSFLA